MSVLRSRLLLCTVLGTITVGGTSPGTGHERRLLAALLVWRRTVVSADRLTDVLWPDGAPPSATNTLQSKISRLRRLVGPGRLIRVGSGYVLELPEQGCDADRFTDLVAGADGLESPERLSILDEALALWTGRAYDDFADEEFAKATAAGLEQRRLAAEEKRLETQLDLGRYDEVIAAAEELIVEDPFRESFWAAEMQALHRSGRSVEALRCYTRARDRFIDETGLPPSNRLSAIEQTILLDDRSPDPITGPGNAETPPDLSPATHLDGDAPTIPGDHGVVPTSDGAATPSLEPEPDSTSGDRQRGPAATRRRLSAEDSVRRRDSLRARPFDLEIRPPLLVGRAGSRQVIDRAVDRLADGRPAVIAVVGDVGVGKTRLIEGAGRRARARGWRLLSGRAVTDVAVPLGPVGQLMSAVGINRPAPTMLGSSAAAGETSADMAVVRLVERLAEEPTVVVLDDLQWSDRQTASAIELLVAEAESRARTEAVPLLIVVAHRRLDAAEPAHGAIERLHRHPMAEVIDLRPLDEAGVAAMVESMTGLRPSGAAAARLLELTDGIPLVVGNVVEHWRGQEQLLVRSGCLDVDDRARAVAPVDLEGDLRARWNGASPQLTDALIALAACPLAELLAPAQAAGLLAQVLDLDVGQIWALLDEGAELGLLASSGPLGVASPRVPAFVADQATRERQVRVLRRLVAEMIDQPRLDRDLTVAESVPSLAVAALGRAEEAGVAEAGELLGAWAVRAAEESLAVGDWSAAARHLTTGIERRPDGGPEVGRLEDGTPLDLALGLASFRANDESWAQRVLLDVAERAGRDGDGEVEGVALSVANRIAFAFAGASDLAAPPEQARTLLEGYIDRAEDAHRELAAKAAALLAEDAADREDFDRAERMVGRARAIGAAGSGVAEPEIAFAAGLTALGTLEVNRADREFEASSNGALAAGDGWVATWGAGRRILTRILAGDLDGADRAVQQALDLQIPLRLWSELALTRSLEASIAGARGRLDRAESVIEEAEGLVVRSGYGAGRLTASPVRAFLAGARGEHDRANRAIDEMETAIGRSAWPYRVLVDLAAGEVERAAELASTRVSRLPRQPTFNRLPAILATAAAGLTTGRDDLIGATAPLLSWLDERGIRRLPAWPTPFADLTPGPGTLRIP